ncbi:MAG: hypothetical protein AB1489_16310, partial [Acidobacteriota bacterium]
NRSGKLCCTIRASSRPCYINLFELARDLEKSMRFKFFHRHTWSTPHQANDSQPSQQRYIMCCYECGAEREVTAPLAASSEVERRIEQARETLQKLTKVS